MDETGMVPSLGQVLQDRDGVMHTQVMCPSTRSFLS